MRNVNAEYPLGTGLERFAITGENTPGCRAKIPRGATESGYIRGHTDSLGNRRRRSQPREIRCHSSGAQALNGAAGKLAFAISLEVLKPSTVGTMRTTPPQARASLAPTTVSSL